MPKIIFGGIIGKKSKEKLCFKNFGCVLRGCPQRKGDVMDAVPDSRSCYANKLEHAAVWYQA